MWVNDQIRQRAPRDVRRRLVPRVRRLLDGAGALPGFIIIGAQKGGTTALYQYLSQHPQVAKAAHKEIHFFDTGFDRSLRWYRSHFPSRRELERRTNRLGDAVLTGEASPYYLFHPHAPRRIAEHLPEARLLVLLRDPVRRAYSHYQHEVRQGRETLDFETAIARETERLQGEHERMLADPGYNSYSHQHFSYAARGIYADQLTDLYCHVPPQRVLVMSSEAFFGQTQEIYDRVTRFLGLRPWRIRKVSPRNEGAYRPKIPGEQGLRDYFEPHNRRLYELMGVDYGW